jgi:hypothetical protein
VRIVEIDAVMSSIEDGTYKMLARQLLGMENGHRPLSKTSQPAQPDAEKGEASTSSELT